MMSIVPQVSPKNKAKLKHVFVVIRCLTVAKFYDTQYVAPRFPGSCIRDRSCFFNLGKGGGTLNSKRFIVPQGEKIRLKNYDPGYTGKFRSKRSGEKILNRELQELRPLQDVLYAQKRNGILVILHGMDASGKDGVVSRVMSGANPNWCSVANFKVSSAEELAHDSMWRCMKEFPERGKIKIFNRSYYEELLVLRVQPELLEKQHLPRELMGPELWEHRFASINAFEHHLVRNGFPVVKIFLHISKEEQKKRLLERIENREKNWKFSVDDMKKRADWKTYMRCYEDIFRHTSTKHAPRLSFPRIKGSRAP